MDFSWSPTDPILALFVPELGGGNQPARVSVDILTHKLLFELAMLIVYNFVLLIYFVG